MYHVSYQKFIVRPLLTEPRVTITKVSQMLKHREKHKNQQMLKTIYGMVSWSNNREGEMTSKNLSWLRYVRHFVGIAWRDMHS